MCPESKRYKINIALLTLETPSVMNISLYKTSSYGGVKGAGFGVSRNSAWRFRISWSCDHGCLLPTSQSHIQCSTQNPSGHHEIKTRLVFYPQFPLSLSPWRQQGSVRQKSSSLPTIPWVLYYESWFFHSQSPWAKTLSITHNPSGPPSRSSG